MDFRANAAITGDGVDVQVTGTVCICTYAVSEIEEIVGGEVTETEPEKDRPGLIIRRPKDGETLWNLAKQYRTSMEAISAANGLEGSLPATCCC